jgi:aryl-alcohol dehydrogenase-like predicted oxidoreductase
LPQLAIAWCLKNKNVSTVILGGSKTTQLKENFAALELQPKLTEDVLASIEQLLGNKPVAPGF